MYVAAGQLELTLNAQVSAESQRSQWLCIDSDFPLLTDGCGPVLMSPENSTCYALTESYRNQSFNVSTLVPVPTFRFAMPLL